AAASLAKAEKKNELEVLLEAVRAQDEQFHAEESVLFDLVRLLTGFGPKELGGIRGELEKFATSAKVPVTRQLGYVALVAADGTPDKAWALGLKAVPAWQDLVPAMPLLRDPGRRADLYPKVEPLLKGLPKELASPEAGKAVTGRFVRVELPGKKRTLTLAEVEVYSDGKNVA